MWLTFSWCLTQDQHRWPGITQPSWLQTKSALFCFGFNSIGEDSGALSISNKQNTISLNEYRLFFEDMASLLYKGAEEEWSRTFADGKMQQLATLETLIRNSNSFCQKKKKIKERKVSTFWKNLIDQSMKEPS